MKKNIHTPQSMNMSVMREILLDRLLCSTNFFHTKEYAISAGADFFNKILEMSDGGPFLIEDFRMGILVKGEVHGTINLIDFHITPGQMVFVGRGSIVSIHRVDEGTILKGFILSQDLASQFIHEGKLSVMNNPATAFIHTSTAADRRFMENMILTTWAFVHNEDYPKEVLNSLFYSVIQYYDHLYLLSKNLRKEDESGRNLFNEFISLVNKYSDRERSISFYADKLCLSPRYFSGLIQEQSGKTAKHWIDTAVAMRAKILLRHTTKSISQVSAELHFPNDSFFCKFFRRVTNCTPKEYREGKTDISHT